MSAPFKIVISSAVVGLGLASGLLAQTVAPTSESPLIQTAHIVGDPYGGFRVSCLIVYPDARYHRERRSQVSEFGHAQDRWESPEVFESQLEAKDIDRLRAIVETPSFRSIKGTVGSIRNLNSMVAFAPLGVVPQDNIEILTVSVAHPNQPQIFEVTETSVAERQEPLRAILEWVKNTESHQAARLPTSAANTCSSLSVTSNAASASSELPTGIVNPTLIYALGPQLPPNTPKPRPITVDLVINPDGTVGQAMLKERVTPDVTQSVLEALRKWRFHPGRLLGVPVAVPLQTKIAF